ncbi:hypothetical protein H8356DRAFT_1437103 [Neocallimastix lanati (nom. inval.)]|nr:hypothetical protein H8356DRAFT_1437103 [Neocallimastix sp. JGI-2020a]
MYQMPRPGGFPGGGYPPPGGPGGFGAPGFPPPGGPGGYGAPGGYNNFENNDDDSEYEYITDDDGDYIEDEDGTILTPQQAQERGLLAPADGERGIGKKLLIGGAILGGVWMLRKQLKKKKKVKKQKQNQYPGQYGTGYKRNGPPGGPGFGGPQGGFGGPPGGYGRPGGFGGPGFGGPQGGFGGPQGGYGRPGCDLFINIAIGQQWSLFNRFKSNRTTTTKSVNAEETVKQASRASVTNEDHNFVS